MPGRILGHEGIGVVEAAGPLVSRFRVGDRVLISCVSACGTCDLCRRGMYSHCRTGGWILGNTIDGTQAEYVRIPHADTSLYAVPANADEEALVMLSDILPTGFECGVINGQVKPGDTVAIVGAGPVGIVHAAKARIMGASVVIAVDPFGPRLGLTRELGATHTLTASAAERAALALTESITRLSDREDPVPDAIWTEAARHYDEKQLAALILAIAGINVWNRLNAAVGQIAGDWKA
jgi:alcohol dehydrogenase